MRNKVYILFLTLLIVFEHNEVFTVDLPPQNTWKSSLKEMVFGNDEILDGNNLFSLETPYRALDAAIVPIKIIFNNHQKITKHVKEITIIVDENPSPVVGTFYTNLKSGSADLSTSIRIDKYTYVRAVAKFNDGKKYMVKNFVKAAGGCSAPSLADMDSMMSRLGKMKMKFLETRNEKYLSKAQLVISHPNFSGLQFNQLTRSEIPAHFIDTLKIVQDGDLILSANADISLSEDPRFTFYYTNTGGPIKVTFTDSDGGKYTKEWAIQQLMSKN